MNSHLHVVDIDLKIPDADSVGEKRITCRGDSRPSYLSIIVISLVVHHYYYYLNLTFNIFSSVALLLLACFC